MCKQSIYGKKRTAVIPVMSHSVFLPRSLEIIMNNHLKESCFKDMKHSIKVFCYVTTNARMFDQSMMEEERLSVKSSTEGDEECYTIKSGSKRKVDFEEEDSYGYGSNGSEDDDEEDSDDLMSPKTVEVLGTDGIPLIVKDILGWMVPEPMLNIIKSDQRAANKDILKLMTKVRTYLRSILQSEGFKCSHLPGHILDITILIPRQKIIDQLGSECYFQMAKLAFDCYIKDNYTEASECQLGLGHVQTVNLWKETDCCYTYYITFRVFTKEPGDFNEHTFEAKVQDIKHSIKVIFCRKAASKICDTFDRSLFYVTTNVSGALCGITGECLRYIRKERMSRTCGGGI